MRKNNNKGFTLLELLISIFILTTVIFIGYSIINKSTTYIQNRKNIHEGQLAVNDINVYLMDDLKCATSVSISLNEISIFADDTTQGDTITNERLKEEFEKYLEYTKNDSSTDIKFTYKYNIDYKKDENDTKQIIYNVDIIKDNNNYKYSISRKVTNEVLITFITNKILTDEVLSRDDKLPLKIELESPYEVTLGYTGKNNYEFVEHQLAIASRLYDIIDNPGDSGDSGDSGSPSNPGDSNNYLWYCLEMAKKSFEDAYNNILDENIKNNLINIIDPIINMSKTNPLDQNKYNEISEKIKILNDNIEKLLGSSEGCLSDMDKYEVFEILKKSKSYLDVAQKTIEESPDGKFPYPPDNSNMWHNNGPVGNLAGDNGLDKFIADLKNEVGNAKSLLESKPQSIKDKYKIQIDSLIYMQGNDCNTLSSYYKQIRQILQQTIFDWNTKVDSEYNREQYDKKLYQCVNDINRVIESIIHIQSELYKIVKELDDDAKTCKDKIIECIDSYTIINNDLVKLKGYLEQATYKDEKIKIYEDIFGEHTHK